jgi:tetratricopeptide (TPR) repeat protein
MRPTELLILHGRYAEALATEPGPELAARLLLRLGRRTEAAALAPPEGLAQAELALVEGRWGEARERSVRAPAEAGLEVLERDLIGVSALLQEGATAEAGARLQRLLPAARALHPLAEALVLSAQAELHHREGSYMAARLLWQKVLALRSAPHPERGPARMGLGLALRRLGQPEKARAALESAVAEIEASLGPQHPARSAALQALAQARHRCGDFEGARRDLGMALGLVAADLGTAHPDTLSCAFELGRLEMDCGDPEGGLRRMEAAWSAARARLGESHPLVRQMASWL